MKDQEWRDLARQNPMRVTYPSWRPKSHWEKKRKADPWKPSDSLDWRKANRRLAKFIAVVARFATPPIPTGKPTGMDVYSARPENWPNQHRRNW